jgi:hypothetical protein
LPNVAALTYLSPWVSLVHAHQCVSATTQSRCTNNMRFFLTVTPVLASLQAVLSAPNNHVPVPYTQAPSYYPGAPWSFPEPQSGRRVCTVIAPENGSNAAPNIIAAFKKCGRNGKVIFKATTCMSSKAVRSWLRGRLSRSCRRQRFATSTNGIFARPHQLCHGDHRFVER